MSADYEQAKRSFRLISNNSPAIMLLIDPRSQRIVAANKAAEKFYGWRRPEFENISINDINSLSTEEIEAEMDKARQSKRNYFRFKHKVAGGDIRDVEVYSGEVKIDGKDYLHYIVHDLTRQVQSEIDLKESKENFQLLLNQIPEALFLHKLDGLIVDYNQITLEKYGYTAGEILQLKTADIDPDYKEREDQGLFWKELNQKKQLRFEARHMKKDGAIFPVEISLAPIEMKGERYYLALAADITERKQVENDLRIKEKSIESSHNAIALVDLDGKLSYVNPAFLQMWGYEKQEEVLGKSSVSFWISANEAQKVSDSSLSQGSWKGELTAKRKNGSTFIALVSANLVTDKHGKPLHKMASFIDITERKQAEQALREHQELLTAIYRNAPLVLMVVDSERRIQQVNGFATQFAGREAEEMLGLRGGEALRCMHALDDPKGCGFGEFCRKCLIRNTVLDTLETGQTHLQIEAPFYFQKSEKEIHEMTFLASTTPITVKNRRMVLVTLQDITERRKAEEEVRKSEEKLQSIFRVAPTGIGLTKNRFLIEVNPKICEMTGYQSHELINKSARILYPSQNEFEFVGSEKYALIEEHGTGIVETRWQKKDGEILDILLASTAMDVNNLNKGVIFTALDITERKRAEENLSHLSQMQSIILRMASDYINMPKELVEESINNSLKELGEFVLADRAYVFEYDWTKNVCSNTYEWCNEGISPEIDNLQNVPNEVVDYWVEAHKHGKEINIVDVMQLPPDDGVRQILEPQGVKSVLALPMMKSDKCIGFIGFDSVREIHKYSEKEKTLLKIFSEMLVNIGNRIELEKNLVKAKEKAEEGDKLKTAFINNISHEIRTPLNGILGFGEILAESEVPAEQRTEMLERVQQSSQRLMNTISDYMDMARIFTGSMLASKKEFALLPLFEEISEEAEHLCTKKDIKFKSETPAGYEGLNIDSDPEFVKKILDKLIDNAIKFTHKGSIACGYKINAGNVEFFVRDTGCGIKSDKLKLIFDMFNQADPSATRNFEGSGLGLSIARGLVHLLGGDIQVASEKRKGSVFTFTIPVDDFQNSVFTATPKATHRKSTPKPLILIAEDEESNYKYLTILLRLKGYAYIHAVNGLEAVDHCRQNPDITLVLMDIKMPEMDGLEATRQIREIRPELPIIATTAYAQTGDEHRILAAGCNEYLAKPIKSVDLMALIGKHAE